MRRLREQLGRWIAPWPWTTYDLTHRVAIPALQDDKMNAVDALLLIEATTTDTRSGRIATAALDVLEIDRPAQEVA